MISLISIYHPALMHGSNKLTAGKSQKKRKGGTQKLMLLKLLQINFFLYFEEIRDHILYATLCNCNLVELQKNGPL